MKLILAQYLRTLKERDEFDRLLPDLLLAMGYVPISLPQTGVRQFGVDLAAVGISPEDNIQELLLLVIKRGDIGRTEWSSGPQSVRQSLDEVFEVYLDTLVEPAHAGLRKKIVLATTGDLKQDTQINWDCYTKAKVSRADFRFWGGAQASVLIEKYMLDEHIFDSEDRTHLRKSLALAGVQDYDQRDLHRLFRRQLGIGDAGELLPQPAHPRHLEKALRIVNLAAQVFAKWSEDEGNLKQALIASERALLWSWHRVQLEDIDRRKQYHQDISEILRTYNAVSFRYFEKLRGHMYVPDGLTGYCRENAEFSLVVFEQIGIISTIGLCQILTLADNESQQQINLESATVIADTLASLITNNPVSASPRLDANVIDIVLGLLLLVLTGHVSQAQDWVAELVRRTDYTFKVKRNFPISTDSIDDLIEATVFGDDELRTRLMNMSWLLPTLAGWAVLLGRDDLYAALAKNSKNEYPEVCLQLWHPTQDLAKHLYYWSAQHHCGESEAPITLPNRSSEFLNMMNAVLDSERHNVIDNSSAGLAGIVALDLIACRHHRTPIAPYFWYRLLKTLPKNETPAEA
ncbi:hypothetical protein GALL_44450 [mine drainage metagenome]|uniref:Uncharacterized protein n=1 Tax=mine drainage metagenome TaxID=410659 RepID=A0A1J5TEP5_9ZZZZ